MWVVAVAGPGRTDGSPGTPSREVLGYSLILDAASGLGTDAAIGELMLRGGRTARLAGGS